MRFDADGRLHVASVLGNEIVVVDPETGDVVSTVGANAKVVGPDDIAFGADGSLYWTSFSAGEVWKVAPDGTSSGQAVRPGVNGIAFSPDGRLFVTVAFMGDALLRLDPDLVLPPKVIAEKIGFLNGIDWGPDGRLYGPVWTTGEVVCVDVGTGRITPVASGFNVPSAVKFDSKGNLCVGEQATGRVFRVDVATGAKEMTAALTPGLDNLAFDSRDRLFVSHGQDGSVFEILDSGAVRTVCAGGMIAPGGIAVVEADGGETVLVADFWTLRGLDCVSGAEKMCHRHSIGQKGCVTSPFTVSADGAKVIVSSRLPRDVVQVFDLVGGVVLEEYTGFDNVLCAVRFGGDIVVTERGTASVVAVSPADPARRRVLASGLGVPAGLAASDGSLWVSDWATGMVLQIAAGGTVLPSPLLVAEGLEYPEGLAVDTNGDLLVVEAEAGRLTRINLRTGAVTVEAGGLAPCLVSDDPTWIFNGVAVGPSGTIYVTSDTDAAVYRIARQR
jgi:sugar lactone lactonase YvrE